jgi:hypothetical protein
MPDVVFDKSPGDPVRRTGFGVVTERVLRPLQQEVLPLPRVGPGVTGKPEPNVGVDLRFLDRWLTADSDEQCKQ